MNQAKRAGGMPPRLILPLAGLACAAFMFNTSEFMPVGLLTDIASSFALTEAQAGMMISLYAWAVMLLSLPLMILGSRLEMRRLLIVVLGVFLVGQVASAAAPTFELLVCARLIVASAHAIFWSIASPLAARVAGERRAAFAMSMVVTGSSLAMICGLPLGRVIGLAVGWRMTFACVAVVAALVIGFMLAFLPRIEAGEPFALRQLPRLLSSRSLIVLYAITALVATGYYTGYSYIDPFFQQVGSMAPGLITLALTVFGCSGIIGSALFSRCYDGHRTAFERIMVFGVALSLALMASVSSAPAAGPAVCALWGLTATAFNVAFQAEVIRLTDPAASAVAMSMFSGLFNLGIGCGSLIGGIVVDHIGIGFVGFVGALFALAGFALHCVRPIAR